jgi:hypothetical protein
MKLNLLVKPVAEVRIGSDVVYLYPLGIGDVNEYGALYEVADPVAKFRKFLPHIASLSVPADFRDKRLPLADALIERLGTPELEALADAYIGIPSFDKVRAGNAQENVAAVTRAAGESAISCLERLLGAEAERHRRIFEKIYAAEMPPDSEAQQ